MSPHSLFKNTKAKFSPQHFVRSQKIGGFQNTYVFAVWEYGIMDTGVFPPLKK